MFTTHYFPESTATMYILVSCALRQDCGAVPIDRRGRRETSVQPLVIQRTMTRMHTIGSPKQPINMITGAVPTILHISTTSPSTTATDSKFEHVPSQTIVVFCNWRGNCVFTLEGPPGRVVSSIQITSTSPAGTNRNELGPWEHR